MEEYVIALIDDGILAGDGLEFNIAITEQGEAVPFPVLGAEGQRMNHATVCYAVMKECNPDARIGSICVMETGRRGDIWCLYHAIRWCIRHKIKFIHMSIGSEEIKDSAILGEVCLEYFQAGGIIVAALSNLENVTVPACFSFVFGVRHVGNLAKGQFQLVRNEDYADISIGAVTHFFWKKEHFCTPCNSYASPAFTAILYRLMEHAKDKNVYEVRHGILAKEGDFAINAIQPDFIDYAVILGKGEDMKEGCFFKSLPTEKLWDASEGMVNLVLCQSWRDWDSICRLRDHVKTILYVGRMPAQLQDWCNQNQVPYWDEKSGERAVRAKADEMVKMLGVHKGILNRYTGQAEDGSGRTMDMHGLRKETAMWVRNGKARREWDMPIIINIRGVRDFFLLKRLKDGFLKEGYNVFAISTERKSYLFGVSKVPDYYPVLMGYLLWLSAYGALDIIFVQSGLLQEGDADLILEEYAGVVGLSYQEPYIYMEKVCSLDGVSRVFDAVKKVLT